jgi:hypothetical protein
MKVQAWILLACLASSVAFIGGCLATTGTQTPSARTADERLSELENKVKVLEAKLLDVQDALARTPRLGPQVVR